MLVARGKFENHGIYIQSIYRVWEDTILPRYYLDITPILPRLDSLSIVSRQSDFDNNK